MGASQSKKERKTPDKIDIEIGCDQIFNQLKQSIEKKSNEVEKNEMDLVKKFRERSVTFDEFKLDSFNPINNLKFITASKKIQSYASILKDNSVKISNAFESKKFSKIRDLIPFFEGLRWSADNLSLPYISAFNERLAAHFNEETLTQLQNLENLDTDLRDMFASMQPSDFEISEYRTGLIKKYPDLKDKIPPVRRRKPLTNPDNEMFEDEGGLKLETGEEVSGISSRGVKREGKGPLKTFTNETDEVEEEYKFDDVNLDTRVDELRKKGV